MKNEKALLFNQLNCVDDHGLDQIKQRIKSMDSSLQTLNQQEEKYTAEVDVVLAQYTELQQQAADMDAMEVDIARQDIRTDKERETARQLQTVYGKKFDFGMLAQSRTDVAEILGEPVKQVSVHQTLQQLQEQQDRESHKRKHSQER